MTGSSREEDHMPLLHIFNRLVAYKLLCNISHDKRCHDMTGYALLTEEVRCIDTVHDRGKHPDLVRLYAVHAFRGPSSPEIPSADHDPDPDPLIQNLVYLCSHILNHLFGEAGLLIPGQSLSGKLEYYLL